jgi:hypothetical protein
VGPAAANAKGRLPAPAGAAFRDDADAYAVALGPGEADDPSSIARALPSPDELPRGTLVVVYPVVVEAPSFAKRLFAAIGRGRAVSRAQRCSALLARGYVQIGAGVDPDTRLDLAWGFSPEGY